MPSLPGLDEALETVIESHGGNVAVVAGAGISQAWPSVLPATASFFWAVSVVATALEPRLGSPEAVAARFKSVRFELFMERLRRAMIETGGRSVTALLVRLYSGTRHSVNHETLARYLGGAVSVLMTTNFDTLIEASGNLVQKTSEDDITAVLTPLQQGDARSVARTVVHLHGSVDDPQALGAFQRRVGRPVTGSRHNLLRFLGEQMPIVLVGYAAEDLDIRPALEQAKQGVFSLRRSKPKRLLGEHVPTDLDCHGSGEKVARRAVAEIDAWVKELDDGDRSLFIAAVCEAAGHHDLALRHFKAAFYSHRPIGGRLGFAESLTSIALIGRGATMLVTHAPAEEIPELLADRALYRRNAGDLEGAIADYRAAQLRLEPGVARDTGRIPELLDVLWREVEARILASSGSPAAVIQRSISECDAILDQCDELLRLDPTVSDSQHHFYRAEVALRDGRYLEADREYAAYSETASYWTAHRPLALANVRRAAALTAAGHRRDALSVWRHGLAASFKVHSVYNVGQYLVGLPVLVLGPRYLWWLRRMAPTWYQLYERGKIFILRLRGMGDLLTLDRR